MELDRTEIVIRQRGSLELMDLSLMVLKRHYVKLLQAGTILGLPLLVVDVLLLHWMISEDAVLASQVYSGSDAFIWWRYTGHLCVLYALQIPIATLPITLYLGAQTFFIPITFKEIVRNLWQLRWPIFWILGIIRLGLLVIPLELLLRDQTAFDVMEGFFLFAVFPLFMLIRTFIPFSPEILGLERCPIVAKNKNQVSYGARRGNLHGPLQGELFVRMIAACFNGTLLVMMLGGTLLFLKAHTLGDWTWNWFFFVVISPLSLWLVGIFLGVYRYLSYIDCRIRLEGWEIELRMRAEAERMENRENPAINAGTVGTEAAR
ncbi:MAG: hypothetical protein U0930_23070 [Pirellulales bacterium]